MSLIASIIYHWVLFLYFLLFSAFVPLQFYLIPSSSMEPTLRPNDLVLALPYQEVPLERGEMVLFYPPHQTQNQFYIKRVLGLPGDHLQMSQGQLKLNYIPLHEPYIHPSKDSFLLKQPLLEREYFVLGDHRAASLDSRYFGPVFDQDIKKRVLSCFRQGRFIALPSFGYN